VLAKDGCRSFLVKPKDKRLMEETAEVVYQVPCKNCDKIHIGETGRKLGTRISEHKKDCTSVEQISQVTRATIRSSAMERNKSAITDHAIQRH
jgi:hypothetical protein